MSFRLSSHAGILLRYYWKFVRDWSIICQHPKSLFGLGKTGKQPRHEGNHQAEHHTPQNHLVTEPH